MSIPLDISKFSPGRRAVVEMLEALPKRCVCAEIRAARGALSSIILRVSQPIELFLIDPWQQFLQSAEKQAIAVGENTSSGDQKYDQIVERFKNVKRVKIIRKTSLEASKDFKDGSLDWVYIDGDRCYDAVSQDILHWWLKIRVGGFFCGAGYLMAQLPEARKSAVPNGVRFAVDEIAKKESLKVKLFAWEGLKIAHYMIWKSS